MIRDNHDASMCMSLPMPWQPEDNRLPMVSSQSLQEESDKWALTGIAYPGKHDVMLGRGGESNYHAGNLTFRSFIAEHKIRYQNARKQEKPIIALEVVLAWRDLSPPGRFLARIDPSRADSLWQDVGDDQACKRAGRTLGEKCSGKAAAKHQQQQEQQKKQAAAAQEEEKKPSSALSGGAAISDRLTKIGSCADQALTDAKATNNRTKRPQASMDFIASFRSRQLAATSSETSSSPPKKKRRMTPVLASRDFIQSATANLLRQSDRDWDARTASRSLIEQQATMESGLLRKPPALVTPDGPSDKVMKNKKVPADIDTVLDDRQREKAHAMRESIPTAEFLTRTVMVLWD